MPLNFNLISGGSVSARFRWLKLLLLAFTIAVIAIIGVVRFAISGDPRSEGRSDAVESWLSPLLNYMLILGAIGVVIIIITYAVKRGMQEANDPADTFPNVTGRTGGFPVVTNNSHANSSIDGPGQYRIKGVHRQTKLDISKYIQADSAANAQVKAELEDIVVTSVQKVVL
jgi:hypothetical protein